MAFGEAMPEAFRVTLFSGSRDNDIEPRVFIGIISVAHYVT